MQTMPKATRHTGPMTNGWDVCHGCKAAKQWLAMMGYDPAYGARPLRRLVQVQIGNQLATMLLSGQIHDGDTVFVDHTADEDKLTLVSMPDDPLSAQAVKKIES